MRKILDILKMDRDDLEYFRFEYYKVGQGKCNYICETGYKLQSSQIMILLNKVLIGYDDGNGNITRIGPFLYPTGNNIQYSSGLINLSFTNLVESKDTISIVGRGFC